VLIAGAGIGGLAAALALARAGIASNLLELREAPDEAGAGIQLGPNATRILRDLGLGTRLAQHIATPDAIVIRRARDGRTLARLPLGSHAAAAFGAPYWTLLRADLHATLLAAVSEQRLCTLSRGWAVDRYEISGPEVRVTSRGGVHATGCALIGADGIWSRLRTQMHGVSVQPLPAGRTAWRALIDRADAPASLRDNTVGLWFGRNAHLVHYPVAGGAQLNIVAVVQDPADEPGWDRSADAAQLMPHFARWDHAAHALLEAAPRWRKWTLFDAPAVPAFATDRVALLGDAAHSVLPFLAQGGALALEDAALLARELAAGPGVPAALSHYSAARIDRAARVQSASRRNGRIYHLAGPTAFARDLVLRLTPGRRLLAGYRWLYG
jgi:salicylate hydroxylase